MPSKLFGRNLNIFFKNRITNPPKNPAISAPKNPDVTKFSSELLKDENVVPAFAIAPPTKPTTNPRPISYTHGDISC